MGATSAPDFLSFKPFPSTKVQSPPSCAPSRLLLPAAPLLSLTPRRLLFRPRRAAALLPTRALVCTGERSRSYDPELRLVLELATDEELFELEDILYGTSYFSPALKSIAEKPGLEYALNTEDIGVRDDFIQCLESRFLFLAADARSTLRGWRPSYRDVLLGVRRKLSVQCSNRLSTEDLEVEIFLHLLNEYSCHGEERNQLPWDCLGFSTQNGNLEFGLSKWKIQAFSTLKAGAKELREMFLKGGGILTLAKLYQLLARRLSGKMVAEAANYQIKQELLRKGGQFAAVSLESRVALLTSKMGFARAASRYLGLQSLMACLGPVLWGIFLADAVIQMLGTDYARILRAIYAFAQIRLTRARGWTYLDN